MGVIDIRDRIKDVINTGANGFPRWTWRTRSAAMQRYAE